MPDNKGVVDLSNIKDIIASKKDGDPDLTAEEYQAVEALAAAHPAEEDANALQVRTAFLVFIETGGEVAVTPDLEFPLVRERIPNSDEIYGALKTAAKDIEVQETAFNTAQTTLQFMQQTAVAQAQAMRNQQLAQQLNLK